MAPLVISRHAQKAGLRRRDDLTKAVPSKRRGRIDFRHTTRLSVSNFGNADSVLGEFDENDGRLNNNQIRADSTGNPLFDKLKDIEDGSRIGKGPIGQFVGNAISRLERKSSTSLEGQATTAITSISSPTSTSIAAPTSTTVIATVISTTDTTLTTSTTSTAIAIPPPTTAVTSPISTPIDPPTPTTTTITSSPPSPNAATTDPTTSFSTVSSDGPTGMTSLVPPNPSPGRIIPLLPSPLDTTSQPRNGLSPNALPTFTTLSTSIETTIVPSAVAQETGVEYPDPAQVNIGDASQRSSSNNTALSPTATHALIAVGTIGAFILVLTAIYFILRMKNIDMPFITRMKDFVAPFIARMKEFVSPLIARMKNFVMPFMTRMKNSDKLSIFRDREVRRGDSGWFGWRKKKSTSELDLPPGYPWLDIGSHEFPADQKPMAQQSHSGTHLSPLVISKETIPQTVTTPLLAESLAESRTQYTFREVPIELHATFGSSQPVSSQEATQSSKPDVYTISSANNINNTYATDLGSLALNVSNSFDPANNQPNRMSQLSSLSSGFGDGQIIIPESSPKLPAASTSQQNNRLTRGFSWVTSIFQARGTGDRDTIYTTTSEETTGRYRTVNSWVAQQTRHIEREQQIDKELPNMPGAPPSIQSTVDSRQTTDEGSVRNSRTSQSQNAPNTGENRSSIK